MDENFDFLKEEVKKQKPYEKWLKRTGVAAFAGLVAGLVILLIMVFVYPRLDDAVNGEKKESVALAEQTSSLPENETEASFLSSSVISDLTEEEEKDDKEEKDVSEPVKEETTAERLSAMSSDLTALADSRKKSLVTVIGVTEDKDWFNQTYENQGQLSGLIVAKQDKAYYILTEYRVLKDVNRIMVTFVDGSTADGRYVKHDEKTGLAVIRVDTEDVAKETRKQISPIELEQKVSVNQGQAVIALGSPLGYSDSMAVGLVTSVSNEINVTDNTYGILNTDIPVSEEGSGILLDMEGNVIGIMAQKLTDTKGLKLMSCLPVSQIYEEIENLCNNEDIPYIGITGQTVGEEISERTGIPKGIWVDQVDKDSPAMVTGIQSGDVIVQVGSSTVENMKAFHSVLRHVETGQKLVIHAMRQSVEGYVEMEFEITVQAR